jgi:HD-like signal output (HDOD) protein
MLIALATVLLVGAAAVAAVYRARAGAAPAAARRGETPPAEIVLEPTELHQLLSPADPSGPAAETAPASGLDSSQVLEKLRELALGAATSDEPSPEHAAVAAAVIAATENAATLRQLAPRRPSLLPQLIRAVNDDDAPRRELAAIIRRDPSLVGNLLEMANSSFYRVTERPVESIDRAVVLLGTEGIRSLIAAAAMQPIFRAAGELFPRFAQTVWEHAWRSANAAVVHAAMVEKTDAFAAELLSLVWGLADVVLFRAALERYGRVVSGRKLRPDPAVIAALLDSQSARVAGRIGTAWELSTGTLAALRQQADPAEPAAPLALLRINGAIDEPTARASLPRSGLAGEQLERMWARIAQQPSPPKSRQATGDSGNVARSTPG